MHARFRTSEVQIEIARLSAGAQSGERGAVSRVASRRPQPAIPRDKSAKRESTAAAPELDLACERNEVQETAFKKWMLELKNGQ